MEELLYPFCMRKHFGLVVAAIGLGVLVSGCIGQDPGPSEKTVTEAPNKSARDFRPTCSPACGEDEYCVNAKPKEMCRPKPEAPPFEVELPFDNSTDIYCVHSSGEGTHSWRNAFWALDLSNRYEEDSPIVRASADGVAFVYLDDDGKLCPQPPGTPADADASDCGHSWGNRVKIRHQGDYFTFYVHLERPLVKTGDVVKKGDPIGVMGWTGFAGHRHLHWSLQRILTSSANGDPMDGNSESVPFKFWVTREGRRELMDTTKLECPHEHVGRVENQPYFRGTY